MRVDFYHVPDDDYLRFACRLVNKAFQHGRQVYVHVASQAEAETLDKMLWTFQQNSFVPHAMTNTYDEAPPPVEIGFAEKPAHHADVLLNLSSTTPDFATEFERVLELVPQDAKLKKQSLARKKVYEKQKLDIKEHQL